MPDRPAGDDRPSAGSARRDRRVAAGGAASRLARAGVAVLLGAALLAGCGAGATAPAADPGAATAGSAPSPAAAAPVTTKAKAPLARSTPERVRVPSIGADSELMSLGLNADRTIEVPPLEQSELAGWYRNFPTPGQKGTSVILGHIDGGGKEGVFYRLQQIRPGQKVFVDRADGTEAVFTVNEVHNFAKDAFPTQRVYGQASDAQLRLISCGGALDKAARSYEDNVVVFATLTGSSRA